MTVQFALSVYYLFRCYSLLLSVMLILLVYLLLIRHFAIRDMWEPLTMALLFSNKWELSEFWCSWPNVRLACPLEGTYVVIDFSSPLPPPSFLSSLSDSFSHLPILFRIEHASTCLV